MNVGKSQFPDVQLASDDPDYAMPFFGFITIPKNTPVAVPVEVFVELPVGIIDRLWFEFPKGCAGLAGLQIWRAEYQIFPRPENVWMVSDNSVTNFAFMHKVYTNPLGVRIKGYNLDDTYQHRPWVAFEMRGKDGVISDEAKSLLAYLKR